MPPIFCRPLDGGPRPLGVLFEPSECRQDAQCRQNEAPLRSQGRTPRWRTPAVMGPCLQGAAARPLAAGARWRQGPATLCGMQWAGWGGPRGRACTGSSRRTAAGLRREGGGGIGTGAAGTPTKVGGFK
jgi:hypothetical protein